MALGQFVWYSLRTTKPAEAQAFLETVLGWTVSTETIGALSVRIIRNGAATLGSILSVENPARSVSRWVGALSVAQVETAAAAVQAKGGVVLIPPQTLTGLGRYAMVRDPQGAAFALFTPSGAGSPPSRGRPGFWAWNELMSRDDAASVAFYTQTFGLAVQSRPVGGGRRYHVLTQDGVPSCGVIRSPAATFPTMWVPYVAVTDCDAMTAKAKAAGARILGLPRDAPGIGRISVLLDPSNAPMGLMQFAQQRQPA